MVAASLLSDFRRYKLLRNKDLPTTYSEVFNDKKTRHDALKELQDATQAFFWELVDPGDKIKDPQPDDQVCHVLWGSSLETRSVVALIPVEI